MSILPDFTQISQLVDVPVFLRILFFVYRLSRPGSECFSQLPNMEELLKTNRMSHFYGSLSTIILSCRNLTLKIGYFILW